MKRAEVTCLNHDDSLKTGLAVVITLAVICGFGSRCFAAARTGGDHHSGIRLSEFQGACGSPSLETTRLWHELQLGWARCDFEWGEIEPRKGEWHFERFDELVRFAHEQGIEILPILDYTAEWAASEIGERGPAADPADWENYVSTVVSRYIKPPYNLCFWQVWNEPTREAGFWEGETNVAWVDQVYLPAARIVRELGGLVVFGGWPCSNSLEELNEVLSYRDAWQQTDYIDVHYFPAEAFQKLYEQWVKPGRCRGVWQTEIGWLEWPGYYPNVYPRVLQWALKHEAAEGDHPRLFWYDFWGTEDNAERSLATERRGAVLSSPHGVRAKVLADVLGRGEILTLEGVASEPAIGSSLEEEVDSIEAFSTEGRKVIVLHVSRETHAKTSTIELAVPIRNDPTRVTLRGVLGEERVLGFRRQGDHIVIEVPTIGLQYETVRERGDEALHLATAYVILGQ